MRLSTALAVIVAFGLAATALAQGRGPTIVVPSRARPQVTGSSPDSGPPGTTVTVTGSGFSRDLRLFLGGRPVEIVYGDESTLQFVVPDGTGRAPIVLRDPG